MTWESKQIRNAAEAAVQSAIALLFACSSFAASRVVDAVKTGDRPTAITLLQQKADVNAAEPDGTTAIAWLPNSSG